MSGELTLPGPHDRVVFDGLPYEVIGYPESYAHAPFPIPPSDFPALFTAQILGHAEQETFDEYGNPVESWSDPVDLPVTAAASQAIGGRYGAEPGLEGYDRVIVDLQLFVPPYVINLRRVEG